MKIIVNTDRNISGYESKTDKVREQVESALSRISERVTRVEVHLSDENGKKKGLSDIRCLLEVRLENHPPLAVTNQSDSLEQAVDGASEKMLRLVESKLGRMRDK